MSAIFSSIYFWIYAPVRVVSGLMITIAFVLSVIFFSMSLKVRIPFGADDVDPQIK